MRIQKYLRPHVAYTNRIRPSTRIRFVSGHLKGLVNRACALRQRIQKYTDTSVHTYPDTQRIQKFPLWRAYTEISGYTERIRRTRVDARCIRIKKIADTKISGYVWTGPENKRSACHREREERPSFTIPPPFAHDTLGLVSAPVGTARWLAESQAWKQTLCFPKILKSLLVSYEDIKWEIAHQVLDLILCPQNLISKLKGQ